MFRALYGQFKRFLRWLNGGSSWAKEAEDHRRDIRSRYPGGGDWEG
jgi:hypothetical protein